MSKYDFIDYDDYRRGLEELHETGFAPRVVLPFAVKSGHKVAIEEHEYMLLAPVTPDGTEDGAEIFAPDEILGYMARRLDA